MTLGDALTDLRAQQNGFTSVLVSWTMPGVPASLGYHITTDPSTIITNTTGSAQNITISTPGVYTIQVLSLSEHLPGKMVEIPGITVQGEK